MRRALAVALSLALWPAMARAQDAPTPEAIAEARTRYERGLELFEEERYDAALAEFDRAYAVAPSYQVLFNIGRIHALRGNAVEAVRAYVRYLAEGGPRLRARERAQVEAEIERQRARIATVRIESSLDGATVRLDGVDVGTTPLVDPLRVNSGEHVVGLGAPGYAAESRQVALAGGTEETLRFELQPEGRGVLRIESPLPGVEIRVDDRVVGTTPLDATVPVVPGPHAVVGRRRGYREARANVDVEMSAEQLVTLAPLRDPNAAVPLGTLRLTLPDAPVVTQVDGQSAEPRGGELELPEGPHAVRLQVADRIPWSGEAWIDAGAPSVLRPTLRWTPEERSRRLAGAADQRVAGIVTLLAGVAVAIGGASLTGWNEERSPAAESEFAELEACAERAGPGGDPNAFCPGFDRREQDNATLRQGISDLRVVEALLLGVGVAAAGVGLVVWLLAPDERGIDASASAVALRIGPGGATLLSSF
ncbi:MAG: PEGA domain-containing protein [Sandaracinaceae bacterium]|nr:PEGA domain-containing protein [Sandaracinaceae bacterium]